MQLPPTILSLDDKKNRKPTCQSRSSIQRPIQSSKEADTKAEDANEEGSDSGSSSNEDDLPDRATQMSISSRLLPKLVPPRTLETTLFDRLEKMYGASIKQMLKIQYRYVLKCLQIAPFFLNICALYSMHDQICAFPSKTLYGSKLKSHTSVASHLLHDLSNAQADSEEDEKDLLQTPVVFFDTAGCEYFERLDGDGDEGSRCNENEGTIVSNWVDKLVCSFQDSCSNYENESVILGPSWHYAEPDCHYYAVRSLIHCEMLLPMIRFAQLSSSSHTTDITFATQIWSCT